MGANRALADICSVCLRHYPYTCINCKFTDSQLECDFFCKQNKYISLSAVTPTVIVCSIHKNKVLSKLQFCSVTKLVIFNLTIMHPHDYIIKWMKLSTSLNQMSWYLIKSYHYQVMCYSYQGCIFHYLTCPSFNHRLSWPEYFYSYIIS